MLAPVSSPLTTPDLNSEFFGPNDRDTLNISAVSTFIRRSWRLSLIWISASLFVGILFATFSRTYYTAYATMLLEDRTSRPFVDPVAVPADPTYVDSQVQVLQSDEVVGRAVDQNRLVEDKEFGNTQGGLYTPIMSYLTPGVIRPTPRYAATTRVMRALSVRRVGLTNVVEIGFTSRNRERAAAIANAIAQSYIEGQRQLKSRAAADAASYLHERLTELRDKAFAIDQQARDSSINTPENGDQARARLREQQNRSETYRALYTNFLQRAYTDSQQQLSSGARVITPAEPPMERSWPRAMLVLAIAAACGAAGGIAHALIKQATDPRLMTPEDVQRSTEINRITTIPKLSWKTIEQSDQEILRPAYVKWSPRLYGAMGKVAVRLQARSQRRRRKQQGAVIIGVVAPMEGAGASSVAVNLAKVIAESGQRTLLVDANWRGYQVAPRTSWISVLMNNKYMRGCSLESQRTINSVREKFAKLNIIGFMRGANTELSQNIYDLSAGTTELDLFTDVAPGEHVDSPVPVLARTLATIDLETERLDVLVLRATSQISELSAALSIVKTLEHLGNYDCVIVDFLSTDQTADLEASVSLLKQVIVVVEAGRTTSGSLHNLMRFVPGDKVATVILNKA